MAELKTRLTGASVPAFIKSLPDPVIRKDAAALSKMMSDATGAKAEMWGTTIVGFGRTPYVGSDKKENDWMTLGFAPRTSGLVIYMMGALARDPASLKKLGKAKLKGGCLHIKKLDAIDLPTLKKVLAAAYKARRVG
ncbi:MAG: DUF1801 domain-containing protein [Gemmatimonadaceae bacterium]|nr:DUF1801 domain-containing protein [Gemmatimonadaceae bacterium]